MLPKRQSGKIETHFDYPPIPDRNADWSATFAGYEPGDLIGRGRTELAAIMDLFQQEYDAGEEDDGLVSILQQIALSPWSKA